MMINLLINKCFSLYLYTNINTRINKHQNSKYYYDTFPSFLWGNHNIRFRR